MLIKFRTGEIIIEPEEGPIITSCNEELDRLTKEQKILIGEIFDKILYCGIMQRNSQLFTSLGKSLEPILSRQTIVLLFNSLRSSSHIKTILDKFMEMKFINENTYQFLLELSIKYGTAYNTVLSNIERPTNWSKIESDLLITGNNINLHSKLFRIDGKIFEFDVPLMDGITFAGHFIQRTIDIIKQMDKADEKILEIDEDQIKNLEDNIYELKKIYRSKKLKKEEKIE